ncbi:YidC/Oxa1 family membrane protein insertase [Saccharothrix ecbatanensis]|uniref:Membrane protein insertase YidC n=1 Tax=Saccharothrix ecbatanensis TaxID=1105145 RepID=A0A7W9HRE2_9PSEU|nr:membrane protein insertase YidC [Saccharothrix ecbatanensis]MBB5806796.1 YidC/Oxa1 family membrane protein insertase [Saccharothrix ecbatanensis]
MLNFIYYPVSFILWCWHWVFGHVFGESSGFAWAFAVVFLVFTLRAILYKPFVGQVRSMRKMQEFAPELQKIKKKYANDKQRQAQEMQKLQSEHGVNPLGGCLPMLVQIPVFIGLFHVLRSFKPGWGEVYFFDAQGVESFVNAKLFGANLSTFITMPENELAAFATERSSVLLVSIPLMIVASIGTHFTARHSVARQTQAAMDNPQTAIMNKLTLYLFPIGVLVGGLFFPIAILLYWLSNNSWTLGQQYVVYHRIDREEEQKKVEATTQRQGLAPKPGAKPTVKPRPGQKPQPRKPASTQPRGAQPAAEQPASTEAQADGSESNGTVKPSTEIPGLSPDRSPSKKQGNKKRR